MRWVYSKQGTIVLSVVPLLIGIAALYGFWRWGGAIYLVTGVVILGLTIYEWVRLYRCGLRRPAWMRSEEPHISQQ
ncbi:hypothetical protein [Mycobacterium intracellulare]|nr:hypothetical protein [Mycobacterium intracellulare]